jgi:hypothetical protein
MSASFGHHIPRVLGKKSHLDNKNMHLPLQITFKKEPGSPSPSQSSFKKPLMSKQNVDKTAASSNTTSSTTTTAASAGRKITFSKRIKVKKVRSYQHYSLDEREAVWHSAQEYSAIKKGCVTTLRLMMGDPNFCDCQDFSARGLEIRTKNAARIRKETKTFAWQAVLDEQEYQGELGVKRPESIRDAYLDVSVIAQNNANRMAMEDQEEVKQYLMVDRLRMLKQMKQR